MKTTKYLLLTSTGILTACNTCQETPPNVIVILADDQGWGDLSINGNTSIQTPNIDRIGREGIQMDNFYVCPVSAPTRAEFLSGKYAYRTGVVGVSEGQERMSADADVRTIANVFQDAGYGTALFGKWHNGTQYPYHPNARGFEEFFGFCSGHWGSYINSPLLDHNGEIVTGEGFLSDEITERAINYMNQSNEKPFFVVLSMNIPHSPMQITDEWWDKWKDAELLQKATNSQAENVDFTRAACALNDNIDWNIGRVFDFLEEKKKLDNTIIVYFSDNGPNSNRWNGDMRGIKASVDEGGVRSTLLMRWGNKLPHNKKIEQVGGAIDLLPTLASMCEIQNETFDIDGMDISDYLKNENKELTPRKLFSVWGDKTSVRVGNYLLSNDDKLYDLKNDRGQQHPLPSNGELYDSLTTIRAYYLADMKEQSINQANRLYTIGHPNEKYSRLPARDAHFCGNIVRSNQYPNCSYLTNWTNEQDKITWDVDVIKSGKFEVILYYTCDSTALGSTITCATDRQKLTNKLLLAADSKIHAAEFDRVPRGESHVLKFKPWSMGEITLQQGKQQICLSASDLRTDQNVMNMALMVLKRIEESSKNSPE